MYRHILVAVDSSNLGRGLVQQAIALAQALKAKLTLLHVLSSEEVISPTMPLIPVPEYYPTLSMTTLELYQEEWKVYEAKILDLLEGYRAEAVAAGVSADCFQKAGRPGRAICDVAKDLDVDLIMVGRRGHAGLSELLIGSVSNYVVHHAPSAVWVCNIKALASRSPKAKVCAIDEKAGLD